MHDFLAHLQVHKLEIDPLLFRICITIANALRMYMYNGHKCAQGTTDVIISFDELYASEECEIQVEVEVESDLYGESTTKVTAAYLNPYSCSFKAPGIASSWDVLFVFQLFGRSN